AQGERARRDGRDLIPRARLRPEEDEVPGEERCGLVRSRCDRGGVFRDTDGPRKNGPGKRDVELALVAGPGAAASAVANHVVERDDPAEDRVFLERLVDGENRLAAARLDVDLEGRGVRALGPAIRIKARAQDADRRRED